MTMSSACGHVERNEPLEPLSAGSSERPAISFGDSHGSLLSSRLRWLRPATRSINTCQRAEGETQDLGVLCVDLAASRTAWVVE